MSERRGGAALPAILPIFPLTGVLLLPRGRLAAQHLRAALSGDDARRARRRAADRHGAAERSGSFAAGNPTVYPTGCAGRITSFSETEDGRFLITLTGVCRFRIREELPLLEGYRRVAPEWGGFAGDLDDGREPGFDRERLLRGSGIFPAAPDLGRLGCYRLGAGRAPRHLGGDDLSVRAEREAGAARGPDSRSAHGC